MPTSSYVFCSNYYSVVLKSKLIIIISIMDHLCRELFASGFEMSMSWSVNFVTTYLVSLVLSLHFVFVMVDVPICVSGHFGILILYPMYVMNILCIATQYLYLLEL